MSLSLEKFYLRQNQDGWSFLGHPETARAITRQFRKPQDKPTSVGFSGRFGTCPSPSCTCSRGAAQLFFPEALLQPFSGV